VAAADVQPQRSTPLRHIGPCGSRSRCPRPSCRRVWGTYATIETFPSGLILARCHGQRWRRGDLPPVAWERTA